MKTIFTIGFAKKSAEEFFTLLKNNSVREVVDIRRNNTSQLSGFTKSRDLKYFLREICNIEYWYDDNLAPTKKLLREYQNFEISWLDYEIQFFQQMEELNSIEYIKNFYREIDRICFLCTEPTPEQCHRRLVAELFKKTFQDDDEIEIVHL